MHLGYSRCRIHAICIMRTITRGRINHRQSALNRMHNYSRVIEHELHALSDAHLLMADSEQFVFRRALVRDAVYHRIQAAQVLTPSAIKCKSSNHDRQSQCNKRFAFVPHPTVFRFVWSCPQRTGTRARITSPYKLHDELVQLLDGSSRGAQPR